LGLFGQSGGSCLTPGTKRGFHGASFFGSLVRIAQPDPNHSGIRVRDPLGQINPDGPLPCRIRLPVQLSPLEAPRQPISDGRQKRVHVRAQRPNGVQERAFWRAKINRPTRQRGVFLPAIRQPIAGAAGFSPCKSLGGGFSGLHLPELGFPTRPRRVRPTMALAAAFAFVDRDLGADCSRPRPRPTNGRQWSATLVHLGSRKEVFALGVGLETGRALHGAAFSDEWQNKHVRYNYTPFTCRRKRRLQILTTWRNAGSSLSRRVEPTIAMRIGGR
jgi:hypothetical protein